MNLKAVSTRIGVLFVLSGVISLSGCAKLDRGDQGEIIGSIAGSMIGRQIGENMDEADRRNTALALRDNRTGEGATWINPDNGRRYTVTPTRTYEASNAPCREFRVNADVGGQPDQEVNGTACLQADGSWIIVS